MSYSLRHTISDALKARLKKLGATVSNTHITATEEQLWRAPLLSGQRRLLIKRDGLGVTGDDSGGYVAKAVHVDETPFGMTGALQNPTALSSSSVVSGVHWYKVSATDIAAFKVWNWFVAGNGTPIFNVGSGTHYVGDLYFLVNSPDYASQIAMNTDANAIVGDAWAVVFYSLDSMSGNGQFFVGESNKPITRSDPSGPGFNFVWSTIDTPNADQTDGLQVPQYYAAGDFSDTWITTTHLIDWSVKANRDKFYDDATGKPVDLGTDGSTPFGYQPEMFFSGDATTWVNNRGSCGGFVKIGTLTNASSSPSD